MVNTWYLKIGSNPWSPRDSSLTHTQIFRSSNLFQHSTSLFPSWATEPREPKPTNSNTIHRFSMIFNISDTQIISDYHIFLPHEKHHFRGQQPPKLGPSSGPFLFRLKQQLHDFFRGIVLSSLGVRFRLLGLNMFKPETMDHVVNHKPWLKLEWCGKPM